MSLPFLGRRFRVYEPMNDRVRPRTCTTRGRSSAPPRRVSYRQSVCLPVLTRYVPASDEDGDSDSAYTERYDSSDSQRVSPRKTDCSRLPAIDRDGHLNARSSRQLVINQQKLMFKYQNLEHEFKKLKNKAALIKRELDRIRVMKTPEPDPSPQPRRRNRLSLWTTGLDDSDSSRPASSASIGSSVSLSTSQAGSRSDSVHLGSSCIFRSEDCYSCSTRNNTPTGSSPDSSVHLPSLTPCSSSPPSPSTSLSGDSSFLYSDTEDEEETRI